MKCNDLYVGRLPAGLDALPVKLRCGLVVVIVRDGLSDEEAHKAAGRARECASEMMRELSS